MDSARLGTEAEKVDDTLQTEGSKIGQNQYGEDEESEYECAYCTEPMDFIEAQFGNMCRRCRDREEEMTLELHHKALAELEKNEETR